MGSLLQQMIQDRHMAFLHDGRFPAIQANNENVLNLRAGKRGRSQKPKRETKDKAAIQNEHKLTRIAETC
jgi:hypothetical protein